MTFSIKNIQLSLTVSMIALLIIQSFILSTPSNAQNSYTSPPIATTENRPKRSAKMLRERQYKIYQEVLELMNSEPPLYDQALEILLNIDYTRKKSSRLPNEYERSVFFNTIANIYRAQENHQKALEYFLLSLDQDVELPYELEDNINFIIGQLNFILTNYEEALVYLNKWRVVQVNPPSNNIIFIANVYYSAAQNDSLSEVKKKEYYLNAIDLVKQAIAQENAQGNIGKENWYLLLRVLYFEFNDKDKVLELSEFLISNWPKKLYYLELSGVYAGEAAETGISEEEAREFEVKQMVAMELAHRQKMLTEPRELESMSQLFLYHEVPYKSAKTMASALNRRISKESIENLDLLAYGYLEAKEFERAIRPLAKAAELADDGERYMRLANLHLQIDNYTDAAEAIDKALEKGNIDRPDLARVIQGQAYVILTRFDEARAVFDEALKDVRSEETALMWLRYINNEEKRIKDIREYLKE